MQWIITKDVINTELGDVENRANRVWNPLRADLEKYKSLPTDERVFFKEAFKARMNYEFQLYDDDGELYYEGMCLDLDDQDEESAFGPLDWAEGDAGCTYMKWRKKGMKHWKDL